MHALGWHRRFMDSCRRHSEIQPDGSAQAAQGGFTFLQISDSHVGFDKAANPNALGRCRRRSPRSKRFQQPGVHASYGRHHPFVEAQTIRRCAQVIGSAGLDVHYVPGEHDNLDDVPLKSYLERYARTPRARAGIPSTRKVSISSVSTM